MKIKQIWSIVTMSLVCLGLAGIVPRATAHVPNGQWNAQSNQSVPSQTLAQATNQKAGMMGRAGELDMRLDYLVVGDSRMMIRGTKGKEGQGKEGTAVALTVLFGPIGLIKHGKNVEVKQGTPLTAYVDSDFTVPVAQ